MTPMTRDEFKAARKTLGLTQTAFADVLGVSHSYVRAMEYGRRIIRAPLAARVRFHLGQHRLIVALEAEVAALRKLIDSKEWLHAFSDEEPWLEQARAFH